MLPMSGSKFVTEINKLNLDRYDKSQDTKSRALRGFRKLGNQEPVMRQWITLMPTQEMCFSTFCGGFKVILGVSAREFDIRSNHY